MDVSEYVEQDAVGLADLIRHGEVSAAEVGAAAAAAIDAVEPALNALVLDRFAEPLAYDASGPLAGVPFAIKDLVAHAAGVPQKAGSRLLGAGVPYPYDTDLVGRFRGAGLAIVGVTATPEFGFNAATEPVATGPVANPWDVTRSPGGSSGGSARARRRPRTAGRPRQRRRRLDPHPCRAVRPGRAEAQPWPNDGGSGLLRPAHGPGHRVRGDPDGPGLRGAARRRARVLRWGPVPAPGTGRVVLDLRGDRHGGASAARGGHR